MDNEKGIDESKMHEKNQQLKECIDLRACSYVNWYNKFHKISLQSVCVPLPDEIVNYLLDEIIILPKECYAREQATTVAATSYSGEPSSFDAGDNDSTGTEPEFPAFSRLIATTIAQLGGSAFIKTNWHSPKDAFWITAGQTMCCKDITDVYQLLKASGICKEDLMDHNLPIVETNSVNELETDENSDALSSSSAARATNQYLVFKKWHDIHPGTEFRCFVRNKRIIGISPRDWPQYHEYICTQKVNIINDIVTMFKEHVKPKFPLFDYIFDVVRDAKDHVFLLDIAPFNEKWSEPLAFEWSELTVDDDVIEESDDEDDPEFRYLSSDCGIQPSKRNNYGIPKDVIDMFRASGNRMPETNDTDAHKTSDSHTSTNTLDDVINNRLAQVFLNQPDASESDDESAAY